MGIWTPSGCDVHHSHQVKSFRSSSRAATRRIWSRDQDAGGVAVLSLVRSVSTSHSSPPHRAHLHFAHLRGRSLLYRWTIKQQQHLRYSIPGRCYQDAQGAGA